MSATTVIFHTNDLWEKHRIIWSGYYVGNGVTLFGDSTSMNLAGEHLANISGYITSNLATITRFDTRTGNLGIAGSTPSGIPYTIVGPDDVAIPRTGGALANYLTEFSTALGSIYIETSQASSGVIGAFAGQIWWHPLYPPSGGWFAVSGIGYAQNDVIGLDYPDNPRVLVSSPELTNLSSGVGSPGVMVINVASGAMQEYRYVTLYHPDIAKNINITDLEAQRILG